MFFVNLKGCRCSSTRSYTSSTTAASKNATSFRMSWKSATSTRQCISTWRKCTSITQRCWSLSTIFQLDRGNILLLFNSIVHKVYIWKWLYFSFIGGFDKKSPNINTANISYFRGYSNLIYTIIYVKLSLFKPFLQLKWLQNDRRLILCFRWKWVKFITFGNEQTSKYRLYALYC
jgi:hypothetical protein